MRRIKFNTKKPQRFLRWGLIFFMAGLFWIGTVPLFAQEGAKKEESKAPSSEKVIEDEFLKLGTEKGIGGKDWMKFERSQIKFQIEQFIPPLLQSAFVGDAFVLPPNAIRFSGSSRFVNIGGNDFFDDGDPNRATFGSLRVRRQFYDTDFFYGFDLNRKYLHSFTARLNVPVINIRTDGFIHPNGIPLIDHLNNSSSLEFGDIGLFLKKKIFDQATFPFGVAMAGSVFFPTGANNRKFGNNGKILTRRPDVSGKLGFVDGNVAPPPVGVPIPIGPAADFPPGTGAFPGLGSLPQVTTPFPFNSGVFGRFSDDGRLPTVLQPGTGTFSYGLGLFFTRQFLPEDFLFGAEGALPHSFKDLERFPGRSAFHMGAFHRFNFENDGIDPGDKTTFFASYVKPFYRDYLSLDLSFVGFLQQRDKYRGTFIRPERTMADFGAGPEPAVIFKKVKRSSFVHGFTGLLAPSLIYSPDPQMRFTLSGLFRVVDPELGPAPPWVVRFGTTFTF